MASCGHKGRQRRPTLPLTSCLTPPPAAPAEMTCGGEQSGRGEEIEPSSPSLSRSPLTGGQGGSQKIQPLPVAPRQTQEKEEGKEKT